ncbi:MAG: MBL fold metallo-hydrolase [Syntrophaceae bacterium]|nr:MBL fold metallo-hydrolase [Syntrophaceae bacterium]
MIIRCWGARGSIPVSGRQYLRYGGDTTCLEIRSKHNDVIIIDAGSGIRRLGKRLIAEHNRKFTLILTHAHWDHIMGFPFFKPLYYKSTRMDVYGCPHAQRSTREILAGIMAPPHFPVHVDDVRAQVDYHEFCNRRFSVNSITIDPIAISHPNEGVGYRFTEDGKSFVFLTDNELTYQHEGGHDYNSYLAFTRNADLLFHDAEYTEADYKKTRTWGHSVYKDALRLAIEAGVKRFGLFHHNQDRSDRGVGRMVQECRRVVARRNLSLDCFAASQDMEIIL